MKRLLLDSGPLGKLCKPTPRADILQWQDDLIAAGWTIILPEMSDFEIRRNLILEGKIDSIAELDRLKSVFIYQPITTTTKHHWAFEVTSEHSDPAVSRCDFPRDVQRDASPSTALADYAAARPLLVRDQFASRMDWMPSTSELPPQRMPSGMVFSAGKPMLALSRALMAC